MVHYKFSYFNLRGRGEVSRMILAYGGADWEDHRIEFSEWKDLKPTFPNGQVPALEVEGHVIGQSFTIARFLANRFGLAGSTDLKKAEADEVLDCIQDIINRLGPYVKAGEDAAKRAELLPPLAATAEQVLCYLSKKLKHNGGEWLCGELTWADIQLACIINNMTTVPPVRAAIGEKMAEKFPELLELMKRVTALPAIAKYISQRPDTKQ